MVSFWCRHHERSLATLCTDTSLLPHNPPQAQEEASRAVQQQEFALARQWQAQRSATPAQKQYAALLLAGGGAGIDSGAHVGPPGSDGGAALRALVEERQAQMQQDAERRAARTLCGGGGGNGDGGGEAAERPAPVLRVRVTGAVPAELAAAQPALAADLGDAILRLWRVSDEEEGLREGDVLRITGLKAARKVDLGAGRMLQLDMTKMSRWGGDDGCWVVKGSASLWAMFGHTCGLRVCIHACSKPFAYMHHEGASHVRRQASNAHALGQSPLSRWELLCRAGDAAAAGYALQYEPRRTLTLGQLARASLVTSAAAARGEFDFTGLLVWAAPPQDAGEAAAPVGGLCCGAWRMRSPTNVFGTWLHTRYSPQAHNPPARTC